MAKNKTNNTKDTKKTVSKTKNATTNVPVIEEQVINTTAETVEAVPVEEVKKNLVSRNNSQLSADGQVQLLGLAAKFFKDDPDAESKYGKKVVDNMNRITAVGIVIAIADQAVNGDSAIGYALRTSPTAYKMLSEKIFSIKKRQNSMYCVLQIVLFDGNRTYSVVIKKQITNQLFLFLHRSF